MSLASQLNTNRGKARLRRHTNLNLFCLDTCSVIILMMLLGHQEIEIPVKGGDTASLSFTRSVWPPIKKMIFKFIVS